MPAEVQIVTDEMATQGLKEAGNFETINKTLISEEYIEPEETVIEINESSQLAQTLLETNPETAQEKMKELVNDSEDIQQNQE